MYGHIIYTFISANFKIYVYFSVLDALAFERLLGPCMDVLKRDTENYKEMLVRAFGSKVSKIAAKYKEPSVRLKTVSGKD